MTNLWRDSGITWDQLLDEGVDMEEFVKDKKVEYTMKKVSHASKIQGELLAMLNNKSESKKVCDFIDVSFFSQYQLFELN